jgi:hypothetical protein
MIQREKLFRTCFIGCLLGMLVLSSVGCGSVRHVSKYEPEFLPKADTRIEVGNVLNETGQTFDIDVSKMFTDALSKVLEEEGLLYKGGSVSSQFLIESKLVEYEPGNAFKRWLLPGWGSTVLSVHCELKEIPSGKMMGYVDARRTVSIGGGYSIGAWRTIFGNLAEDVVDELKTKIPK